MRYLFDAFALDTAVRELSEQGATVKIEPKVFELLLYLVETRGRTVSKDDVVEARAGHAAATVDGAG